LAYYLYRLNHNFFGLLTWLGVWCVWLVDKSIHPSIHVSIHPCIYPSIGTLNLPASGTHSFYWPILAKGMSYDSTDKLKLRFDDETRGGQKKKKKKKPRSRTHPLIGSGWWVRMEFCYDYYIILQFGRFGGCLFTCLIPFPGVWCLGCCWTPHLVDVLDKLFHCLYSRVELDCIEMDYYASKLVKYEKIILRHT